MRPTRSPRHQTIAASVDVMRSVVIVVLGALQGFGAVSGSAMSNTATWSILGTIIALSGIAIAFAGWRGRKS